MPENKRSLLPAIFLILLGGWFLLNNFGLKLPSIEKLWPIFIIFAGFWSLGAYYKGDRAQPSLIFSGLTALGMGVFFLLFTLNVQAPIIGRVSWGDMAELWPAFLVIPGLAGLGQFVLTGMRDREALGRGIFILAMGLIFFVFTLDLLSPNIGGLIAKYWPLILIVIGLGIIFRGRKEKA